MLKFSHQLPRGKPDPHPSLLIFSFSCFEYIVCLAANHSHFILIKVEEGTGTTIATMPWSRPPRRLREFAGFRMANDLFFTYSSEEEEPISSSASRRIEAAENWDKLDSLTKLRQKKNLNMKLATAKEVNAKIKTVQGDVKSLEEQIRLKQLRLDELRMSPHTDEDIRLLEDRVQEIAQIEDQFQDLIGADEDDKEGKSEKEKRSCPICFYDARNKKIFNCVKCNNWLCGGCNKLASCPMCRCSLHENPLKRNKTLEMIFSD